ncbi:MAG: N-acetyltransferase [Desulfobulbaceae bacterium]|uniref:N-acetyltransferase n=1 Tax=Candidatus Desulfatifera sulfidica TaxID=2841691 RepID=A0A8J6N9C8_9BACT|nr:N-acetyltransferase [Candidatus Desulfatifera sulfidica]
MNIRLFQPQDQEQIVAIYNQAVADGSCTADTEPVTLSSKRGWFNQHPEDHYPIFVAAEGAQIQGWCSLSPHRPGRKGLQAVAEISYYIERDHRAQGLGNRLMDHAIAAAPALGLQHLFAILLDCNKTSIHLLEKKGFTRWGHLPGIVDLGVKVCGQYIYGRAL